MGQLDSSSSSKMHKSAATVKKSSSGATKAVKPAKGKAAAGGLDFSNPKTQTVLLVGLLAVLALALWYGVTHGCLRRRRRRRRSSC